jgi:hypothetical protein
LQRDLLRRDGIAGLLQHAITHLIGEVAHRRVEGIERFVEPAGVKDLPALGDGFTHGGADTAAFVAQEGEEPTAAPRYSRGM